MRTGALRVLHIMCGEAQLGRIGHVFLVGDVGEVVASESVFH